MDDDYPRCVNCYHFTRTRHSGAICMHPKAQSRTDEGYVSTVTMRGYAGACGVAGILFDPTPSDVNTRPAFSLLARLRGKL